MLFNESAVADIKGRILQTEYRYLCTAIDEAQTVYKNSLDAANAASKLLNNLNKRKIALKSLAEKNGTTLQAPYD